MRGGQLCDSEPRRPRLRDVGGVILGRSACAVPVDIMSCSGLEDACSFKEAAGVVELDVRMGVAWQVRLRV